MTYTDIAMIIMTFLMIQTIRYYRNKASNSSMLANIARERFDKAEAHCAVMREALQKVNQVTGGISLVTEALSCHTGALLVDTKRRLERATQELVKEQIKFKIEDARWNEYANKIERERDQALLKLADQARLWGDVKQIEKQRDDFKTIAKAAGDEVEKLALRLNVRSNALKALHEHMSETVEVAFIQNGKPTPIHCDLGEAYQESELCETVTKALAL